MLLIARCSYMLQVASGHRVPATTLTAEAEAGTLALVVALPFTALLCACCCCRMLWRALCCCCGRKKGGGQYARAGIDEHDDDGYDDVLDGYPYDDYDDEMEAANDDGGAFRPPRLPPALVVDHTRARDGGREKAGLVYV